MYLRERRIAFGTVAVVLAVVVPTQTACHKRRVRDVEIRVAAREDEPGAAAAFAAAKRVRPGSGVDTRLAYSAAREKFRALPLTASAGNDHANGSIDGSAVGIARGTSTHLNTWTALGPGNIGGRTRVLAIDPRAPERMIAAGVSGGLWLTNDAGGSWRAVGDDLVNLAVNALATDPADPDSLWAGTGEGYFREVVRGTGLPLRGGGIFHSTDGGETWGHVESTSGSDFQWVNDLLVSHNDSRRLYAATRTGVWRSDDSGVTWSHTLATDANGGCLDLAARTDLSTDVVFASCGTLAQAAVYRRLAAEEDGEWSVVLSEPGMGRTSLAIAPSNQGIVYALAASNVAGPQGIFEQGLHAVFRSLAGGDPQSWVARLRNTSTRRPDILLLANPIALSYVDCGFATYNSVVNMGWYVNVIAVDPVQPNRVWAAGVDLFRSDDGGRNWGLASYWWADRTESSFLHADQHGIVFHPHYDGATNQTMFATNDGGVFRTDNGTAAVATGTYAVCDPSRSSVRWTPLNHGYGVTQFYHGAPTPDGTAYLGGTQDNGTLVGTDAAGPDAWSHILGGDGGYVAVDPRDTRVFYAETQWFSLRKSIDGGATFNSALDGVSDPAADFLFITPFLLDPGNPDRLWAGGRRIWRSDDGAGRWNSASTALADGGKTSALAVAPTDSERVLVGTSLGSVYRTTSASSVNGSTVWHGARPRPGWVTSLSFDPLDPTTVYATYGDFGGRHVWRSRDGGVTWGPIDGDPPLGLPDIPVHTVVIDPVNPGRIFLGTDLGVVVSNTGGFAWARENTGFAAAVTEALVLTPTAGNDGATLFAFTHGRGAWKVSLRSVIPSRAPRRTLGR